MYYEIFSYIFFIYKFNWLFNNNNTSIEFFFSSLLSSNISIFVFRSGHANVHRSIAEKKRIRKKMTLSLLIVVVFVEWTFLTLIRGDSPFFFSFFCICISTDLFYFFLYVRIYTMINLKEKRKIFILCVFYWSYRLPVGIIVLYIVHLIEGRSYEKSFK